MSFDQIEMGIRLRLKMLGLIQGRNFDRLTGSKDSHSKLSQLRIVSITLIAIVTIQPFLIYSLF